LGKGWVVSWGVVAVMRHSRAKGSAFWFNRMRLAENRQQLAAKHETSSSKGAA
jgi:hypothetical protein